MMVAFYVGCGLSLIGAALAPSLVGLAVALFVLGVFAAIYHPVGTAMIIENATQRGRTMAFNGVCGNLGVSLAAGITAVADRGAVLARRLPGAGLDLHRDRRDLSLARSRRGAAQAAARSASPDVSLSDCGRGDDLRPFRRGRASAGLVFNTHFGRAAEDRRRARRQRHFAGRGRRPDHGGVPVRRDRADHGRPPGRALSGCIFCSRISAVMQFAGVVWAAYASGVIAVVRARLHHGGDLRPDHRQRSGHRPLHRRCLARPRLCGALFPHLHDLRRRRCR